MKATETICVLLLVSLFVTACSGSGTTPSVDTHNPTAQLTVEPSDGYIVHEGITFDATESVDNDDKGSGIVEYAWDFENDGVYDLASPDPVTVHTYSVYGSYNVQCRVRDNEFEMDTLDFPLELYVDGIEINFPDPDLDEHIRYLARKPVGQIYQYDTRMIEFLDLYGKHLDNLEGIQDLPSLISIRMEDGNILDVSAISECTDLEYINIMDNFVGDFSIFSDLVNLKTLNLTSCSIGNISGIENMTGLTKLIIRHNDVTDLTPIEGLTDVTYLDISRNGISDIGVLSNLTELQDLYANQNEISDISVLEHLENLRRIELDSNNITDLQPIVDNSHFRDGAVLDIRGNYLYANALNVQIPELIDRGVEVIY